MQILKYTKKGSNKYELTLKDNTKLTLYTDLILKYDLLIKKKIDSNILEVITSDNLKLDCYYKALKYLKNIKCTKDIKNYLKDYPLSIREYTITRLTKEGYLNDNKYAGLIDLVLEKQGDVVVSPRKYFNGVFKLSPKMELDVERIPAYFLMQLGGGIVEGERYNINVELKENVRAIVTTQAASKVYKCENSYESFQETTLKLEENSILEYITDPVILYKDAVYRQENNIYMTKSSTLIYTDGITSGWSPDKKRFQYEKAKLKTNIYMDGVPVLLDNMLINPREDDIDGLGFMEGYKNFATLIILDDRIDKNIIEHLREEILKLNLDINFGITGLEVNGFVLRVIGNLTQDLEEVVGLCHNYIRRKVLNSQNLTIRKL